MEVEKELIALRADEKIKKLKQSKKEKEGNKMTNKKIEKIMARAIKTAYSKQNEEILSKLGSVEKAVQSAKDDIDYNEVKGMAAEEAYIFYYEWALVRIMSVL